jgi:hypothetical protein
VCLSILRARAHAEAAWHPLRFLSCLAGEREGRPGRDDGHSCAGGGHGPGVDFAQQGAGHVPATAREVHPRYGINALCTACIS